MTYRGILPHLMSLRLICNNGEVGDTGEEKTVDEQAEREIAAQQAKALPEEDKLSRLLSQSVKLKV